nr:hypothetical protein [Pyrinomonadaceae bacterium]
PVNGQTIEEFSPVGWHLLAKAEGDLKDGYCFRPDDYKVYSDDRFKNRPIVRIVKANWQKAYRDGKIKYDYKVAWK